MSDLLLEVRCGVRQLFRHRTSSIVAIVTLALGIGVTAAVFSVADATMLRPLPFPHPEQLVSVRIEEVMADGQVSGATVSMAEMRALQEARDVFSFVAGTGSAFAGSITDSAVPERIAVAHFTEDYLSMLGVSAVVGRGFTRDDMELSSPMVAMLSYGYWQSRFGRRHDVLGQTIRLSDDTATIVGVLPAGFNAASQVSTPLRVAVDMYSRRGTGRVGIEARLRDGVTIQQASARLSGWNFMPERPGVKDLRVVVESDLAELTSRYRTTVLVFFGAVALILALAAVNVAGLLLARGSARQMELAVRASLGAGRGRLVRQLFIESIVIAIPALALGLLLAWGTLDAIVSLVPLSMPENAPVTLNLTSIMFTATALVAATLGFGLLPAFQLSRRIRMSAMVSRGARQLGSQLGKRGGQLLIASEIALAVVLVAGAGLMIRSFIKISGVELGFTVDDVITAEIVPLEREPLARKIYFDELLARVRTLHGVQTAGIVDNFALGGGTSFTGVSVGERRVFPAVFRVSPGYFESIGIVPRQGRLLTGDQYQAGYRGVVINESAARALFQEEPAVGRTLTRTSYKEAPWTVIGVIGDLRHRGPLDQRSVGQAQVFFPFSQTARDFQMPTVLVVRRALGAPQLGDQLRDTARAIGPPVLIERIRGGGDWFTERVITPRRRMMLLGLLGALGLALALIGVFGMTTYAVTRRTAEIGVRLAFGAQQAQVIGVIVRDATWPLLAGVAVGTAGALAASRVIESFLFQTDRQDPLTLVLVAGTLLITGVLAALAPALRAASIDPMACLRTE